MRRASAERLNLLFVSRRLPYPFSYDGGAERSAHWLAAALAREGHAVRSLGSYRADEAAAFDEADARPGAAAASAGDGAVAARQDGVLLRVVRRADFATALRQELERDPPDLVVAQLEGSGLAAAAAASRGIPSVLRLVGPPNPETYPELGEDVLVVANSPLTARLGARQYRRRLGFIITPVEKGAAPVEREAAICVSFVNPRRDKGLHLFARIAGLRPRLPFLVVPGWRSHPHDAEERQALAYLRRLPNVSFHPPSFRMSEVYDRTRLLLVPSRWPESWPRVVGEAQARGIPVLASEIGSLPLAVAAGGVVLPYGDPELWCRVLDRAYGDADFWACLSRDAVASAGRFREEDALRLWQEALLAARDRRSWAGGDGMADVPVLRAARNESGGLALRREQTNAETMPDYREPAHH